MTSRVIGTRTYTASASDISMSGAGVLLEVHLPVDVTIEILSAWIIQVGDASFDHYVYPISIYGNDTISTGGTAVTPRRHTPSGAASICTAHKAPTIGATDTQLYQDAFHVMRGWLYQPLREERIILRGNTTTDPDNIGLRLQGSRGAKTWAAGITWSELGATV